MNDGQRKPQIAEDAGAPVASRSLASLGFSIAVHAAVFAAIVYFAAPPVSPHRDWVLAYLVEIGDGHAGGGAAVSSAAAPTTSAGTLRLPAPRVAAKSHSNRRPSVDHSRDQPTEPRDASREPTGHAPEPNESSGAASSRDSAVGPSSPNGGSGGDGGAPAASTAPLGAGNGIGDGAGDNAAHADYGMSPPPIYPASARRHEQQGTVTLRVRVGADGSVERVEIAESSGFDTLDNAALETVRARWRFVPAHRGAVAFESWVLVPIRFALTRASAAR